MQVSALSSRRVFVLEIPVLVAVHDNYAEAWQVLAATVRPNSRSTNIEWLGTAMGLSDPETTAAA